MLSKYICTIYYNLYIVINNIWSGIIRLTWDPASVNHEALNKGRM